MPTADLNKTALQNLLARANAKTGVTHTYLTDAIATLEEGYKKGGSAECSGEHVITVGVLPERGVDKGIYKLSVPFSDLVIVYSGDTMSFLEIASLQSMEYSFNTIPTKTTEGVKVSSLSSTYIYHWYYIEDENDVFLYGDLTGSGSNDWVAYGDLDGGTFNGCISDVNKATADGYYAIGGNTYYQYHDGLIDVILGDSTGYESMTEGMGNVQLFSTDDFPTDPVPTDLTTETLAAYYIKNDSVNDIYLFCNSAWVTLGELYNSMVGVTISFAGEIHDPSLISAEGYYALTNVYDRMVFESDVYVPTSEEKTVTPTTYDQEVTPDADYLSKVTVKKIPSSYIIPTGEQTYNENGEFDVTSIKKAIIAIPDKATVYTVNTVDELPADAVDGSLAIVLGGE